MSAVRTDRKAAIRAVISENKVRTQSDVMRKLGELGFEVTQATVSRDMAALELEKDAEGYYVLPEVYRLRTVASTQVREVRRAGNQVVIISGPGAAQSIAAAIDAAQPAGVLGTIAGDDTILVIAQDDEAGAAFQAYLQQLAG